MSGGSEETIIQNPAPTGPGILPGFEPFIRRVGKIARGALDLPEFSIGRFAQDQVLQIPGLSPLEQAAAGLIGQRGFYGIPTPPQEQLAFSNLAGLPGYVGQSIQQDPRTQASVGTAQQAAATTQPGFQTNLASQVLGNVATGGAVPTSPHVYGGLGTAFQAAGESGQLRPEEALGVGGLAQFIGGAGGGSSQAIQQAIQGLESQIVPAIQNQAALSGLAQSGFMPQEVSRAYARELVPLYQQGLQQQQQAAGQLIQAGQGVEGRRLLALQQLRDAQMATGQTEQALATDAELRRLQAAPSLANVGQQGQLLNLQGLQTLLGSQYQVGANQQQLGTEAFNRLQQSVLGGAPELRQLGGQADDREVERIKELMTMGDLERSIAQARAQADFDSYMRQRELGMSFVNPYGNFPAYSQAQPSTTTRSQSGGLGLGK